MLLMLGSFLKHQQVQLMSVGCRIFYFFLFQKKGQHLMIFHLVKRKYYTDADAP